MYTNELDNQSINKDWRFLHVKSGVNNDLQVSDGYGGQSYCLHVTVCFNEGV